MSIKICLDAGHFGKYNQSPVCPDYYESERMWLLTNKLAKALRQMGMEVSTTRNNPDKDLSLIKRGQKSRDHDLLLSLHSNAAAREDADHVVLFVPVKKENKEVHEISLRLAKRLAPLLGEIMGVKEKNYRIASVKSERDRDGNGKMDDDYYGVLHGASTVGTPALIIEHSFHTNENAARWLMDEENLEKLAYAEAEAIADFFKLEKPVFRVQVGAYTVKANAEKMAKKLKAAGFDCFVKSDKDYYRVQTGTFTSRLNAEKHAKDLTEKGFSAIIKR